MRNTLFMNKKRRGSYHLVPIPHARPSLPIYKDKQLSQPTPCIIIAGQVFRPEYNTLNADAPLPHLLVGQNCEVLHEEDNVSVNVLYQRCCTQSSRLCKPTEWCKVSEKMLIPKLFERFFEVTV